MAQYYGAGRLDHRAEVLECRETSSGIWEWVPIREIWVSLELKTKVNVYSKIGVGAKAAELVAWKQDITLFHAIRQGDRHLFLTSITERNRNQFDIKAALVEVTQCEDRYGNIRFPAVVTEQYHGHEQLDPQAINTIHHVLVTPKCIELKPGRLVEVGGEAWPILTAHTLDPFKNEYVIGKVVDL